MCLLRCLVEHGTAVAHVLVAIWPNLLYLSAFGTLQSTLADHEQVSMRPISDVGECVLDHFRRVPVALVPN